VSIGEMTKDPSKIEFLSEARRERVWDLRRVVVEDDIHG
jgi:hypothetical protein